MSADRKKRTERSAPRRDDVATNQSAGSGVSTKSGQGARQALETRMGIIEAEVGALKTATGKFDDSLQSGLKEIAVRLERIVSIEADQRAMQADVNRAHDKIRSLEVLSQNLAQIHAAAQSALGLITSEIPKISAALNGEGGLVAQMAHVKARMQTYEAYAGRLATLESDVRGKGGLGERCTGVEGVSHDNRRSIRIVIGVFASLFLLAVGIALKG